MCFQRKSFWYEKRKARVTFTALKIFPSFSIFGLFRKREKKSKIIENNSKLKYFIWKYIKIIYIFYFLKFNFDIIKTIQKYIKINLYKKIKI